MIECSDHEVTKHIKATLWLQDNHEMVISGYIIDRNMTGFLVIASEVTDYQEVHF